jgi:hypothetical protein
MHQQHYWGKIMVNFRFPNWIFEFEQPSCVIFIEFIWQNLGHQIRVKRKIKSPSVNP